MPKIETLDAKWAPVVEDAPNMEMLALINTADGFTHYFDISSFMIYRTADGKEWETLLVYE